jgi:hypothetical protein
MNENQKIVIAQNDESAEKTAERVNERLTVEVPTEVKAGALPTHCSCPPDCCC